MVKNTHGSFVLFAHTCWNMNNLVPTCHVLANEPSKDFWDSCPKGEADLIDLWPIKEFTHCGRKFPSSPLDLRYSASGFCQASVSRAFLMWQSQILEDESQFAHCGLSYGSI